MGGIVFRLKTGNRLRRKGGRGDWPVAGSSHAGFTSGVMYLGRGKAVMPMYRVGQAAQSLCSSVVFNEKLTSEIAVRAHADGAYDDHRRPSGRAPLDKGDLLVRHAPVFRHVNRHGGHDETVFQGKPSYIEGLKQRRDIHQKSLCGLRPPP